MGMVEAKPNGNGLDLPEWEWRRPKTFPAALGTQGYHITFSLSTLNFVPLFRDLFRDFTS